MQDKTNQNEDVDALCKECGHAFKLFIDRILSDTDTGKIKKVKCPVCGCSECKIGH